MDVQQRYTTTYYRDKSRISSLSHVSGLLPDLRIQTVHADETGCLSAVWCNLTWNTAIKHETHTMHIFLMGARECASRLRQTVPQR